MVCVNGNTEIPWSPGMTVRDVLAACQFTYAMIEVFVNGQHVPREQFDTYPVPDGADVRILHHIAGG